jgi:GDP-L-fucose synthase
MRHYDGAEHINVGSRRGPDDPRAGGDLVRVVGCTAAARSCVFDPTKPDGTPRKLLDVTAVATAANETHRAGLAVSRRPRAR